MSTEQQANGNTKPAAAPAAVAPPTSAIVRRLEGEGTIDAFASEGNFAVAQRMGQALAASSLVPDTFRNNLPNVMIAMEVASRIGASVFAVMQNMDVIHGRPSFRATFLIATVNASGRFTPLRFRFEGAKSTDEYGCRAVSKDRESGELCEGALITIGLAKAEGWATKNGSKWKTMPEQMLMYRAASFWQRVYAPELGLGMSTEESHDVGPAQMIDEGVAEVPPVPGTDQPGRKISLRRKPKAADPEAVKVKLSDGTYADAETGEVEADEIQGREPGDEG
jgi:hypothetical protein